MVRGHCVERVDAAEESIMSGLGVEKKWKEWNRVNWEREQLLTFLHSFQDIHEWRLRGLHSWPPTHQGREGEGSSKFLLLFFSVLCTAMAFLLKNKADKIQHVTFWKSQLMKAKLEIKCNQWFSGSFHTLVPRLAVPPGEAARAGSVVWVLCRGPRLTRYTACWSTADLKADSGADISSMALIKHDLGL